MSFRKVIFWVHLLCGVITGIVIFIMSITGVALTYEKQMTAWADQNLYQIQIPEDKIHLSAETLIEKFRQARPDANPARLTLYSDPASPASIMAIPGGAVFVNPYNGEILGTGAQSIRKFFRFMTDLHRWLALTGENRGIGRAITGACNMAFFFLVITGFYLWWPRKWTLSLLRATTWFRRGLSSKARDSNWHYVFGFWCALPLVLVVGSAIVISYPWASNLVFQLAGSEISFQSGPRGAPSKKVPPGGPGSQLDVSPPALQLEDIDDLVERTKKQSNSWKTIGFQIPTVADKTVVFTIEKGTAAQPQHRSTITFDKNSLQIVRSEDFKDQDPGLRARIWMRFVHTGEYYGILGQTIAGIVSIAGVLLVWTGIALSYRRHRAWILRKQKALM